MKDTKLSLESLEQIIICGQCGALFLAIGWSNEVHNQWHRDHPVVSPVRGESK